MMPVESQVLADVAIAAVKSVTGPLLERIAVLEQRNADLAARLQEFSGVRDRLVVMETKAAMPVVIPPPPDVTPLIERLAVSEQTIKELQVKLTDAIGLRDRVVAIEVRDAQPPPDIPPPVDVAPVLERVAAMQERLSALEAMKAESPILSAIREDIKALRPRQEASQPADVSDRVLTLERERVAAAEVVTKHIAETREQLTELEKATSRNHSDLKERIAVLESRPSVPGPQGPPGEPGPPGKDGRDGDAQLPYQGVYQEGKSYDVGQMVTWGGSMWHCNESTTSKPGEGLKSWTLVVKRGRDGRDGKDAATVPVVSIGGRT